MAVTAVLLGAAQVSARTDAKTGGPSASGFVSGPGSLDGMWIADGPLGVKPPSLTRAAKALLDRRNRRAKTSAGACVPPGMPDFMDPKSPAAIQVIETPEQGQISVLSESYRTFRIIHLDAKHSDDPDPTFQGQSVGRWEGDTLVVDTIGLQATTDLFDLGIPHSEDLHLVERIRRTGRTGLEDLITIEDPSVFSRSWVVKVRLKRAPVNLLQERICER